MSCFLSEAESRWRPRLLVNRSRGGRTQLCDCGQPSPSVCAGVSTRNVSRSVSVLHSFWLCSSFGVCLWLVYKCPFHTYLFRLVFLYS